MVTEIVRDRTNRLDERLKAIEEVMETWRVDHDMVYSLMGKIQDMEEKMTSMMTTSIAQKAQEADVEAKVMEIDRKLKLVADGAEKAASELKGSTDWGSWSIAEEEMFQDLAARVEELEGGSGHGPTANPSDFQWQMDQMDERMEKT